IFGPDHAGPIALSADSRLVCAGLIDIANAPTWSARVVGPAQRVVWHLVGDDAPDPKLPLDVEILARDVDPDAIDAGTDRNAVLFVVGNDRTRRLQAAAARLPRALFLACNCPDDELEWQALVREATISDTGIVLHADDELPLDARHWIERT